MWNFVRSLFGWASGNPEVAFRPSIYELSTLAHNFANRCHNSYLTALEYGDGEPTHFQLEDHADGLRQELVNMVVELENLKRVAVREEDWGFIISTTAEIAARSPGTYTLFSLMDYRYPWSD